MLTTAVILSDVRRGTSRVDAGPTLLTRQTLTMLLVSCVCAMISYPEDMIGPSPALYTFSRYLDPLVEIHQLMETYRMESMDCWIGFYYNFMLAYTMCLLARDLYEYAMFLPWPYLKPHADEFFLGRGALSRISLG